MLQEAQTMDESKLDNIIKALEMRRNEIERDINSRIQQLHKALEDARENLLKQLGRVTEEKISRLVAQTNEIEKDIKNSKDTFGISNLEKVAHSNSLKPNVEVDIEYSVSTTTDIEALCGYLSAPELPDSSKCTLEQGVEPFVVGEENCMVLQIVGFDGDPLDNQAEFLDLKLVSEITRKNLKVTPFSKGKGQYELRFTPTIKGRHKLHVKINRQHTNGSPFILKVKSARKPRDAVLSLSTPISTINGIESAHGIAVTRSGEIAVTQWHNHCVSVFSLDGKQINSIGTEGSSQGEFRNPHQLTQDDKGNFYVTDFSNQRIQKFSADWKFLGTSIEGEKGSGGPLNPAGIVFNATNQKVYVSDEWGRSYGVHILNADLSYDGKFMKKGIEKGLKHEKPWGIACDSSGKLYVTDLDNYRILVFTAEGEYLSLNHDQFQVKRKEDTKRGELSAFSGIAIDRNDYVYVSESGSNDCRISVFNPQGKFVKEFGEKEKEHEVMRYRGIAVDDCGVVYACDEKAGSVLLF